MFENVFEYIKNVDYWLKAELFLRILIALLCGAFIGYERTNRGKGAGIRTHTIVAVASCLMMIISQYGFEDFFNNFNYPNVDMRIDPTRIAAQIVSGIGFLGAGMIFIQKNVVTGLTTAAGIWAVSGIGMAIGCGMYFMGIACTVIIVVIQLIMHKKALFTHLQPESEMSFLVENNENAVAFLLDKFTEHNITLLEISYNKKSDDMLEILVFAQFDQKTEKGALIEELYKQTKIIKAKV